MKNLKNDLGVHFKVTIYTSKKNRGQNIKKGKNNLNY